MQFPGALTTDSTESGSLVVESKGVRGVRARPLRQRPQADAYVFGYPWDAKLFFFKELGGFFAIFGPLGRHAHALENLAFRGAISVYRWPADI